MANLIQHAKDQVSQLTAQAYAAAAAAGVLPPGVEVKGSVKTDLMSCISLII